MRSCRRHRQPRPRGALALGDDPNVPVLIAGAGIAGLTLAIALARKGVASRVIEARAQPPREGAGIQLGPNATRILDRLGLATALAPHAVAPECIIVNDGISGRELTRLPLGERFRVRHGAAYWVVHRAALHEALWRAATAEPAVQLECGRVIRDVDESATDSVTVGFESGDTARGALVVGADGIWSRVRAYVAPHRRMAYSGMVAARSLVRRDAVEGVFAEMATGVWLSPEAHVVHYPVDGGETLAIVAIGRGETTAEDWGSPVAANHVRTRFTGLAPAVRGLIAEPESWRQWALYRVADAGPWTRGRCGLIGDAAHPILPYLAQGGAMAIEDADELAGQIAGLGAQPDALAAFTRNRRQRVQRVQAASVENGRIYHLSGPAAAARNLALRTVPGALLMRRYDWVYGYGR